ncbi:Hypothetical_protein [Hexamita inflata]|uniref:Hypothetical_protein n=1 Tax=Hexamita inflata TaxID=28002 RepID=A0AA86QWC3_9EUKA|nr:Hypothetical protein HINF_LOCUS730 [Hexamita inflata]CAI9924631.1 Hypothetical protein HINF_LOCUS12276 [Hexamita inflata]CAI9967274.1 Hypothetical protein HINF_LOCUS54919 [Hexamita inflata]
MNLNENLVTKVKFCFGLDFNCFVKFSDSHKVLILDLNREMYILIQPIFQKYCQAVSCRKTQRIQSQFEILEFTLQNTLTGIMYYSTAIGQNGECPQNQSSCGERFKSEEIIKFKILFSIFDLKLWGQFSLLRHIQLTFTIFANSAPNFVEVLLQFVARAAQLFHKLNVFDSYQ